jgi:hypothetical protein
MGAVGENARKEAGSRRYILSHETMAAEVILESLG